jgi:DNA-binding winged helix-turn-helix (wHTH) protein/tetratricopeptide (TPR) repeat protein
VRYRFSRFELDRDAFELRENGDPVAAEPQVLSLLLLLASNAGRLVTRDEIVRSVWKGRIISEAAISSRVKAARRAIGDDGSRQEIIRTVHGKGFRFDAPVEVVGASPAAAAERQAAAPDLHERPSIAVLPLQASGDAGRHEFLCEAVPHEIIVELCRLRWLFVIARGSSFRFGRGGLDPAQAGALLGVRYCLSGLLEVSGNSVAVLLDLADTRSGGLVWCDRFALGSSTLPEMRAAIIASIVAALEIHIADHEARLARGNDPDTLDAWAHYHLGLRHMYRFNRYDNARALELLTRAVAQHPQFARGHAALSFTHFQNAFLGYVPDTAAERLEARRSAERALDIDQLDPSSNVAMGRSLWLSGELESSLVWLDRAVGLSPSYAQAIYARAWTETLSGDAAAGQRDADAAMALSPIDPLRYAMTGTRALSHLVRGEYAEAAPWADRAARDKGAHALMSVIAAACVALAGDEPRARFWAADVRRRNPALTQDDFFRSFPFADVSVRRTIAGALEPLGI